MNDERIALFFLAVQELLGALANVELLAAPDRIARLEAALQTVQDQVDAIGERAAPEFWREGDPPPPEPDLLSRFVSFQRIWYLVAKDGKCDEWGSAECERVFAEWKKAGCPDLVATFIVEHANRSPAGGSNDE